MEFKEYTKTHELDPNISDSMWREIYFAGYRMFSPDHPQIKLDKPLKVKLHKYSEKNNYNEEDKKLFVDFFNEDNRIPIEGTYFRFVEEAFKPGLSPVHSQELKCYTDLNTK